MPGMSFMFMESYSDGEGTVSFPGVEAVFTGFKGGGPPAAQCTDGTSVQTAQSSGTTTGGASVSGTFTYRASRTSWTWYETARPDPVTPRHAIVNDGVSPFNNIINAQIQDENHKNVMVPYADFVTLFNLLVADVFVSNYERQLIVPGRLWYCHTDVDYKLN